jgi:SH3-like domain-containing protein
MTKYFTNNFSVINLYKKRLLKSEIVTQMIYGESFSISKKKKKWLKIKIKEDNYKGYIQNKKLF